MDGGLVLIGGSPLRIVRLTDTGMQMVDRWAGGAPVGGNDGAQRLARRLLDGGLAHPRRTDDSGPFMARDVAVVIPLHGRPHGLPRTLAAVRAAGPGAVVVVDDGSSPPDADRIRAAMSESSPGGTPPDNHPSEAAAPVLLRSDENLGPGAARQLGVASVDHPVAAFVDADVVPEPGWLDTLLAHLADPAVAAVAPRVIADPPGTLSNAVAAYERVRSSLDRGPVPAPVRPRSRVSYVPTACLLVRRAALEAVGGFDPDLRVGEDVDLVWRLVAAGWTVRYEPSARATHPARSSVGEWLRQRVTYGRSAAPLAARHGGDVAPLTVSGWSALGWGLVALGAPSAGAGVMAGTTAALVPKLRHLDRPVVEAIRLAGLGNLFASRQVASALRRAWFPLLAGMLLHRRTRPAALAALLVPPVLERREAGVSTPPLPIWAALSLADDLAYGIGLWAGVLQNRGPGAWRALVPAFAGRFPPPEPSPSADKTAAAGPVG